MEFEWAHIWFLWLLPLPLLVYLLIPPLRKGRSALRGGVFFSILELTNLQARHSAWISKRNLFQWTVMGLAWIGILLAAAGPQYVNPPEKKTKTVRNFVVVADISFSMDTRDWVLDGKRMTRWEAVKSLLKDFMASRESDQIGLIFFGSNAYLQSPLTADLDNIQWQLDQTEVGMAGQMTGIGNALGLALQLFQKDSLEEKVILLLTDGVESGSDITPQDAAEIARTDSVTIYTLGIGSPNASDLDSKTLTQIAERTGGEYFLAIDPTELEKVYKALDELEPVEYEYESYSPVEKLFYIPLLAVLGLTAFSQILIIFTKSRKR